MHCSKLKSHCQSSSNSQQNKSLQYMDQTVNIFSLLSLKMQSMTTSSKIHNPSFLIHTPQPAKLCIFAARFIFKHTAVKTCSFVQFLTSIDQYWSHCFRILHTVWITSVQLGQQLISSLKPPKHVIPPNNCIVLWGFYSSLSPAFGHRFLLTSHFMSSLVMCLENI